MKVIKTIRMREEKNYDIKCYVLFNVKMKYKMKKISKTNIIAI